MVSIKYLIINSDENDSIAAHFHSGYELTYYISGKGFSEYQESGIRPLDDKQEMAYYLPVFQKNAPKSKLFFEQGSCVIFPPYTLHNKKHLANSEFLAVVFDISNPMIIPKYNLYSVTSGRLQSLFQLIINEYRQKKANYTQMIECILAEICIELNRILVQNNNNVNDFITQTIHYIDDYFLNDIDFNLYCKENGYSIDYFRHKFKEYTNSSPKAYLLDKRMEYACSQLEFTKSSVADIAEVCRFGDYAQFSTYFSKKYHLSPMQYRKSKVQ